MDQQFTLTADLRDEYLVLTTSGYINNVGGEAIAAECQKHFAKGVKDVILNVEQSKVVNSIGMSYLIEVIEQLQEIGGTLVFTHLDPAVEKMLAIMGLFKFAGKEGTVDDALAALTRNGLAKGRG
jgi:anti-anti-sigma factor